MIIEDLQSRIESLEKHVESLGECFKLQQQMLKLMADKVRDAEDAVYNDHKPII